VEPVRENSIEDIPNVIEVKDVTGQGAGMSYKLVYKVAGVQLPLDCTRVEYADNERITIQVKGAMNATQTFELKPLDAGSLFRKSVKFVYYRLLDGLQNISGLNPIRFTEITVRDIENG